MTVGQLLAQDAQHLGEFDAGRLFRVRGWLLSETEAQLYALVARRQAAEV